MIIQNTNTDKAGPVASPVHTNTPKITANTQKIDSTASTQPPSFGELKSAISVVNRILQQSNHSLEFSVDSSTKKPVVKLVDTETGELITQYPSDAMLAISRSIDEFQQQQGLLLTNKA